MTHDLIEPHQASLRVSRLVVAPHAGDEVVGCGGLLARHHDDVLVVILVEPGTDRLQQLETARHVLGSPPVMFLDLPDAQLADHMEQIVAELSALIARVRPAELYLPYPLLHQDHVVAYEAAMRATRPPVVRGAWAPVSVLVYDAGGVDVADFSPDIRWGVGESLREEDVDRSVEAAAAYRSPVAQGLKERAQGVGRAKGLPWAEQFALVRTPPELLRRATAVPAVESVRAAVPAMAGGDR